MTNPNVFYFNPTCELAVANGSFSYMPPLLLQEMESDLSILPLVFGNSSDYVLTNNPPSADFTERLQNAGFDLPKFIGLSKLEALPEGTIKSIQPWGWDPATHFKFKNLKQKCTNEFKTRKIFNWQEEHQILFERKTSLDFLKKLISDNQPDWFISNSMIGEIVSSCEEIEDRLRFGELVIKAPLSSSGRGIQIIRKAKLNDSNKQWISGILKQQKYLIAEPFLDKILDFSFQFHVFSKADIKYLGYSVFETNTSGQYRGTLIHPDLQQILPDFNSNLIGEMIELTAKLILERLGDTVYSSLHSGYLGIDSMLFKEYGKLRIQPCVEINSRMNMGILTMLLEKKFHREAKGKFEVFYGNRGDFYNFSTQQTKNKPIKLKDGKLFHGFLPLVEPTSNKRFGAYIDLGFAR
jgi:hypothetical protein